MRILIKYVLKNMIEKKFRLFLIAISIILSSALFFASSAITDNVTQIYAKQMRQYVGDSDLTLRKNHDAPYQLINTHQLHSLEDITDYRIGVFFANGTYTGDDDTEQRLMVYGTNLEDLDTFNRIYLTQHLSTPFEKKSVILSQKFAEENKLKVGDRIEFFLGNGQTYHWQIWGIGSPKGLLQDSGFQSNFVVPLDTVNRLYGYPGKVNQVFLKMTDREVTNSEWIDTLSPKHPDYEVEESLSEDELREAVAQITVIFQIMLVLVVFVTIYIIYTSFKVMMSERMPVIGTFRSIGATRRSTNLIMMSESIFYGLIGGSLGVGLGIVILKLMTDQMAYDPWSGYKMDVAITFSPLHVLMTLGMAVTLAIISSVIPIWQASRMSIKDIVLDKSSQVKTKSNHRLYIGLFLIVVAIAGPVSGIFSNSLALNILCMVLSIVAMIMILPFLTHLFLWILERVPHPWGNSGTLAVKNLNDNKSIQGNIILLTIGIASLIMINIISYSVTVEVLNVYNDGQFEIWSWIGSMNRQSIQQVRSVDGVIDAHGAYELRNVLLVDRDEELGSLMGIDPGKYFDYWDYEILGDRDILLDRLDDGRYILMNRSLTDKYGYKPGDMIRMEMDDKIREYMLIGMTSTLMQNGQMAFISDKYFRNDTGIRYYDDIYIKTSEDPSVVNTRLKDRFVRRGIWSEPVDELQKANQEQNDQLFIMLQGFSVLTMIIGIFGVFNNYLVSMLHRKRSLAMYRSVGMSKRQMRRMLYIESATCGLIGGLTGVAGGLLLVFMVSFMMKAMNLPVAMHINNVLLIQSLVGAILVSLVASISPVIRSSKMSIIQAIKYE